MAPQRLRAGLGGGERDLRAWWEFLCCDCCPWAHACLQALPASCCQTAEHQVQGTDYRAATLPSLTRFGYSAFLLNSYLTLRTPRRGTLVLFSVSLQTTTPFPDHYVCFKVKSKRYDSHRCLINVCKGSLPQCVEPLCPKLVNCLGLHLWKNHHHPTKRAHLGHVCQTSVKQELSDEEKQLFQAQHARGPTYKLGTSKPDHLQLQVASTTAGSVLHFWISERWKVLLPQKETPSPSARPASLGGEDRALAEVSQLSAPWKGPPFPLPVRADPETSGSCC